MDELFVVLLGLVIIGLILWFMLGTIVIWGGVVLAVASPFVWSIKSKWNVLASPEKASGLVTLSFAGGMARWEVREPAWQSFLETRKFGAIGICCGVVWIMICGSFGLCRGHEGWGIFFSLVVTPFSMPWIIKGYSWVMRLLVLNCVNQAGYHLGKADQIRVLEQKIAATSRRMGFEFPLTHFAELRAYVENNAAALMSDLKPLEQEIATMVTAAEQVLACLEDAERDLARANKAYDDSVRVVIQSGSDPLIKGLDQIHNYLNTTALTDFLIGCRWQEYKEAIAAAIVEIGNLVNKARKPGAENVGESGRVRASKKMTPEDALKVLGLKAGYNKEQVDKAYIKLIVRFGAHPNGNHDIETSILPDVDKIAMKLGEAKLTLLQQLKSDV